MWTYEDKEGLIENITVRRKYKDNVYKMIQLLAHDGYAIHDKRDDGFTDPDGNYYPPTYSYQYTSGSDSEASILENFEAVLITPGMEVVGVPKKEETE